MQHRLPRRTLVALLCLAAAAVSFAVTGDAPPSPAADAVVTVPGMPPVPDPNNLYSEAGAGKLSAAVADALPRIYVPNVQSNDVYVIDPATMKVVDRFKVGVNPQHVVPSWDLKTLWVANNAEGRTDGSLTPIDPVTGKPGAADRRRRSVQHVFHAGWTLGDRRRRGAQAARLSRSAFDADAAVALPTPQCDGINHADFSIDGRYAIFTCEFQGSLVKIDLVERKVLGYLKLVKPAPQEVGFNIRTGIDPNLCTATPACRKTSASRPTASSSTSPTWKPTGCSWSTAPRSGKSISSPPASARMASTRAAMAKSSTSPIADRTRSMDRRTARAAFR